MSKNNENEQTNKERIERREENDSSFYGVDDIPPIHMCILFALQQILLSFGGSMSISFIFANLLCASDLPDVRAILFCITVFMCGVATFIQTTVGIRIGIIQGASHTFVAPVIAMMAIEKWKCPDNEGVHFGNGTFLIIQEEPWIIRIRELQGNLILASVTQVILGSTGLAGFLMKFIGPLTIIPTVSLIGLSLVKIPTQFVRIHWGISVLTIVLTVVFSLLLGKTQVPIPAFTKTRKCHFVRFRLFLLLPVLLSAGISWTVCHILTVSNVLPNNSTSDSFYARTDARLHVVNSMPWFFFPYPFQFGRPTFSTAVLVGMLAATISSIMESMGDYFVCARISKAPVPPPHALNRGIAMEGLASIISGMLGAGHATTSYSGNIGIISITKVASRRVFQTAGVIMMLCGVVGKFGAVMTIIPEPIVGGVLAISLGLVTITGFSNIKYIDITSSRNLTILALSIHLGLMVSSWIQENPSSIHTGSSELDQVLTVLLGTAMLVGGTLGFIMDNVIPGTKAERGLLIWRNDSCDSTQNEASTKVYDIPYITEYLRRQNLGSALPVSPTFDPSRLWNCLRRGTFDGNRENGDATYRDESGFLVPKNDNDCRSDLENERINNGVHSATIELSIRDTTAH